MNLESSTTIKEKVITQILLNDQINSEITSWRSFNNPIGCIEHGKSSLACVI